MSQTLGKIVLILTVRWYILAVRCVSHLWSPWSVWYRWAGNSYFSKNSIEQSGQARCPNSPFWNHCQSVPLTSKLLCIFQCCCWCCLKRRPRKANQTSPQKRDKKRMQNNSVSQLNMLFPLTFTKYNFFVSTDAFVGIIVDCKLSKNVVFVDDLLTSSDSLLVCCSSGWTPSTASKTVTGLAGRESDSFISDTSLSENHDCTWRLLSALNVDTLSIWSERASVLCMFAPYRTESTNLHIEKRERKRREDREREGREREKSWEEHIQIKTNYMKQQQQQQQHQRSNRSGKK